MDGSVRLEMPDGHEWIAKLVEAFPGQIESITLGKPTLEDVFIDRTGRRLEEVTSDDQIAESQRQKSEALMTAAATTIRSPISNSRPLRRGRFGNSAARLAGGVDAVPPRVGALYSPREPRVWRDRATDHFLGAVGRLAGSFVSRHGRPRTRPPARPVVSYGAYFFPGIAGVDPAVHGDFHDDFDHRRPPRGVFAIGAGGAVPRWSMVAGKVLGGSLIALAHAAVFLLLGFTTNVSLTFVTIPLAVIDLFIIAVALTSLGTAIAWRMQSTQGYHAIMMVFLLPMWLLSGAFAPRGR